MNETNLFLLVICSMMLNAVLFGVGAVTVLSVPALEQHAKLLMPVVIVASFALAPVFAGRIARRMRIRNWGKARWKAGDAVSG